MYMYIYIYKVFYFILSIRMFQQLRQAFLYKYLKIYVQFWLRSRIIDRRWDSYLDSIQVFSHYYLTT